MLWYITNLLLTFSFLLYYTLHCCYIDPGQCEEGSVRLADGVIEQEGRVEVCVHGVWGSVCDDGWDKTDGLVVCSQMGYPRAGYKSVLVEIL